MEKLRIGIVQTNLFWENPEKNKLELEKKIAHHPEAADVFILPEMFSTGFSMEPEKLAENMDGSTITWMKNLASTKDSVICGSIIIKEREAYFNRFVWVEPNGKLTYYDKRHAFSLAGEQHHYQTGQKQVMIDYKGWKIAPFICYDLRFPVWIRNTQQYDLAIFVANWPEKRSYHWKQLLIARAIENQCFVAGVNRVGEDKNGFSHSGDSVVLNALGETLSHVPPHEEMIEVVELQKEDLSSTRRKLNFLADQDQFKLL